jgi:precorrin-3B synthase
MQGKPAWADLPREGGGEDFSQSKSGCPARRGACPGLSAPTQTGDGLLARLTATGTIPLPTFAGLCASARAHGNGIIEITSRGSLQVRGLDPASADAFAGAVATIGIDAADGVAILTNPLTGLDPSEAIEAGALAVAMRKTLSAAPFVAQLGPKVSVVIDGGGVLHLDALRADLRFRAETRGDDALFHVGLGGDAAATAWIGAVPAKSTIEASLRLLAIVAAKGAQARADDVIRSEGTQRVRAAIAEFLIEARSPPLRPAAEPIDCFHLQDGSVAGGLGLAFGHTDTVALERLVDAAQKAGATGVRTAPGRALLLIGIARAKTPALIDAAKHLGFIVQAIDPRRSISACAGAPLCASGKIPARELGPELARAAARLLDGSLTLHLSGCAKGCAHRGAAALTIVGNPNGFGVVVNGCARDAPVATLPTRQLRSSLTRLAHAVESTRRPNEHAAHALSRLGAARIAKILADIGHG